MACQLCCSGTTTPQAPQHETTNAVSTGDGDVHAGQHRVPRFASQVRRPQPSVTCGQSTFALPTCTGSCFTFCLPEREKRRPPSACMCVRQGACVTVSKNLQTRISPEASAAAAALAAAVVADSPMLTEGMLVDGGGNADMLVSWRRWAGCLLSRCRYFCGVLFFARLLEKARSSVWRVGTRGEDGGKGRLTFRKKQKTACIQYHPSLKVPFPDKHERWFRAAALTLCTGKESAGSAVYGTLPAAPQSLPDVRVRPQPAAAAAGQLQLWCLRPTFFVLPQRHLNSTNS